MYTQTISIKIDQNTNNQLSQLAKRMNKGKSNVIRMAIRNFVKETSPGAGKSLVKMAQDAKKYKYEAPYDVVSNLNKYLYGKY